MPVHLIIALALVVAKGFFVASEFAIARVRPTQAADWITTESIRRGGVL